LRPKNISIFFAVSTLHKMLLNYSRYLYKKSNRKGHLLDPAILLKWISQRFRGFSSWSRRLKQCPSLTRWLGITSAQEQKSWYKNKENMQ